MEVQSLWQLAGWLIGLFLVNLLIQRLLLYRKSYSNGCEPPKKYPHTDPVLGSDIFFKTGKALKDNTYLDELYRRYTEIGTTFSTINLGRSSLSTVDPENLRCIFSTNFNHWGVGPVRHAAMSYFCGTGFLTADGKHWEHSKALLLPSFDKRAIMDFSVLDNLLEKMLSALPDDGTTVDLHPLIDSLFVDTNTHFLFGESVGALGEDGFTTDQHGILRTFDAAVFGCGMRIALGPFRLLGNTGAWREACRQAQAFTDHYVQKSVDLQSSRQASLNGKQSIEPGAVLLHSLAQHTNDKRQMRNEVIQAFFTAQTTTSLLISNVLWVLARSKDIWHTLRDETLSTIGNAKPTYHQVIGLPYMRKVINESLRLHPVLPKTSRTSLRDTRLPSGGGKDGKSAIYVPKGTIVEISHYVLHRLPSIWGDDAAEFKPERWDTFRPAKFEYLAFGSGPRQCVAQHKAYAEAAYVLCRVVQQFQSIQSHDEREWKAHVALSAINVNGCRVGLTRV